MYLRDGDTFIYYAELMLAITEYNYFKPAAGVPVERSIHNPSLDYERNEKCTSIAVTAGDAYPSLNIAPTLVLRKS